MITRPIIILSAPRAGSTLLFETLVRHPALWSIGGESHALIEHVPALSTVARGYVSNQLDETDASDSIVSTLHQRFLDNARLASGERYDAQNGPIRLLEKTPKNALRVAFLNKVFPDALFLHLVRDPRENISSIADAWESKRFVTYPNLPGWDGDWSLLLPPGWQSKKGAPLEVIAAYQWQQANQSIIDSLSEIPAKRSMLVHYDRLIEDPTAVLNQICSFAGLSTQPVNAMVGQGLPLSRYTLSAPQKLKWHKRVTQLPTALASVQATVDAMNERLKGASLPLLSTEIDSDLLKSPSRQKAVSAPQSRNAPCPCGSGQRYKLCHGRLN